MDYHLKVSTLNFSGVNVSPFEYHDGSQEKSILDQTFRSFLDRYNNDNPKVAWNIAKLDKVFQKERYTILYLPDCGCVRGKLLTKQQFEIVWDRTFEMNQAIVSHMNLSDQIIDTLRSFDFMIYKAYLHALFGNVDMNRLDQYSSARYMEQLKKWHSKSYLNQSLKINYVKEYLLKQDLDVLFLQEALTGCAAQFLPNANYSYVRNGDSMIIYKRDTYFLQDHQDSSEFDEKFKNMVNFNKDSCYYKCKDVLLLSVHLSSKKTHLQQAKQMFETLDTIQKQYRQLKIVVGIDANHKLNSYQNFKVFPQIDIPTTRKKRTYLQCQFQKANKLVEQSKDFIIANLPVSSSRIETIRSAEVANDLLPNDGHPFDHFVVSANLEFHKPTFRTRASGFLKHFAQPIKILISESKQNIHRSVNRTFEEIVNDLVAHLVPPDSVQSFRGFRKTLLPSPAFFFTNEIHQHSGSPGSSTKMESVITLEEHLTKWQISRKSTTLHLHNGF